MRRFYFVSEDLEELKNAEIDFNDNGIGDEQLHVLSEREAELEKHDLHELDSFSKSDVFHSGIVGALIGAVLAFIVLAVGVYTSAASFVEWMPFVFLAAVVFLFSTWEGGLFGIQIKNIEFRRFENLLREGKHILMVDVDLNQIRLVDHISKYHPALIPAGEGSGRPSWLVHSHKNIDDFVRVMP